MIIDEANNNKLLSLFSLINTQKVSHVLVMGDFNYPRIDFASFHVNDTEESESVKFFDAIQDQFLTQHVRFNTRFRSGNEPSLLDYVFTNEEGMVDKMECLSPLGKSDHVGISWEFKVGMEKKTIDIPRLDYWRGDYVNLNEYLNEQDWDQITTGDVMESWRLFKDVLMEGVNRYIPVRKDRAVKQKKKLPLEIRKGLTERNRLWKRY